MLKEEEFKAEIAKAMARLANETRRAAGLPELEPMTLTPQVISNDQLDLFSLPEFEPATEETVQPLASHDSPMTVGELRKQMGFVVKAKKKQVSDDQILLFAL